MRLVRGLFAMLLVAGLLLSVGITPRAALAEVAVVGEGGYGCTQQGLEDAITATATADSNAPGHVTFNCPSPDHTIVFSSNIDIGGSSTVAVVIDGSNGGGDQIVLDGNEVSNFFNVADGGYLSVQRFTMRNGKAPEEDELIEGGAIDVDGSGTLSVLGVTFISNEADWGGAIDNDSVTSTMTMTINQSRFISNEGWAGGAIYSSGDSTISQSSFVNNTATNHAGALDIFYGTTRIIASTFSGNKAPEGSAINIHPGPPSVQIAWSTIIQPSDAGSAALYINDDITLTGVILGGDGDHCKVGVGELANSYSLANDDSCGFEEMGSAEVDYADGLSNLGLGPLTTSTINGVEQSFYTPIASPALDGGPQGCDTDIQAASPDADQLGGLRPQYAACDIGSIELNRPPTMTSVIPNPTVVGINQPVSVQVSATDDAGDTVFFIIYCDLGDSITTPPVASSTGTFTTGGTCSYSQPGSYAIRAYAIDGQYAQSDLLVARTAVRVAIPTALCADQWSGSLSMGESCGPSETLIELPTDGPITMCVNDWNGSASLGTDCSRSEHQLEVTGDGSIAICVNRWNGALRVSDRCGRSEYADVI